jgi:hypothetical protein
LYEDLGRTKNIEILRRYEKTSKKDINVDDYLGILLEIQEKI